jgi:hypothetical protein
LHGSREDVCVHQYKNTRAGLGVGVFYMVQQKTVECNNKRLHEKTKAHAP